MHFEVEWAKYKTTGKNQKEICTGDVIISKERPIEEEISYLKKCRALIDENGNASFLNTCYTWKNPNKEVGEFEKVPKKVIEPPKNGFIKPFSTYRSWKYDPTTEINLTYGSEGLVWNVFRRFSKKDSSFHSFQEASIPSARCHPETAALIEKIKAEAFNNPQHILNLIKDFRISIIDSQFLKERYKEVSTSLAECKKSIEKYKQILKPLLKEQEGVDSEYYDSPVLDAKIAKAWREIYSKTELSNEVNEALEKCKNLLKIEESLNIEIGKKERDLLKLIVEERKKFFEDLEKRNKKIRRVTAPIGVFGSGPGAVYLSYNAISAVGSAGVFLGGPILGAVAAGVAGFYTYAFGASAVMEIFKDRWSYPIELHINRLLYVLEKRMSLLSPISPEKLIEIEPISLPSEIDPRMRVSKFTWAVTVVVGPKGSLKNHAAIIIEGLANEYFEGYVPDGEYFIHKSEYNPSIKSHLYSVRRLKHNITLGMQRTRIWMRSSEKVIKMLQEITKEQRLQDEKLDRGEDLPIAITGSDSLFSGGADSCFTWIREKCTMLDIKLGKSIHSLIVTRPRAFTDPFEEHQRMPVIIKI